MREIFSLEIEQEVIAGLLKHPEYYYQNQINSFLNEDDFANNANKTIFVVILNLIKNNEHVEKLVVAERIKSLGIVLEVSPFEYLRSLNVRVVSQAGFNASVKELKKLWIRRKIRKDFLDGARAMEVEAGGLDFTGIISKANQYSSNTINLSETTNQPRDLFKGIKDLVESIGNDPQEDGLLGPYPIFQKWFGSFTKGDVYVFSALYGVGKSTLIDDILLKVCTKCNPKKKVRGLILDTELETERVQFRKVGSLAKLPPYLIRTGKWRLNEKAIEKVRGVWNELESLEGRLEHIYVGSMTIDEITAIARRWAAQKRAEDPDVELIIGYDYIKISEGVDDSNKEYQIIGSKVNELKKLATEVRAPLITGLQLNRQNDLAMSQRVGWYASYVFKLRRKIEEELILFPDWGNCILEIDKTREWGEDGFEINKQLSYLNSKKEKIFTKNYLNFKVENFDVEEVGTADEMIKKTIKLNSEPSQDDGELL